jgi:hypothetical protein
MAAFSIADSSSVIHVGLSRRAPLEPVLRQIVAELQTVAPDRTIEVCFRWSNQSNATKGESVSWLPIS